MAENKKLVLTFERERETKNTVRYQEVTAKAGHTESSAFVGTLYLRKEGVQFLGNPDTLTITIEAKQAE